MNILRIGMNILIIGRIYTENSVNILRIGMNLLRIGGGGGGGFAFS